MYMKFSVNYLAKFICLSCLFFLAFIAVTNLNLSEANAAVSAAPNFTLKVLNRSASNYNVFSLNNYKGHIVILNFWATWCPPCRAEMPMLVKFYNFYRVKGVIVVGINVNNNIGGVSKFLKLYGISYPVVYANPDVISEYGGINEIPQTFYISKTGKIMFHWVGQISRSALYGITNKLLKKSVNTNNNEFSFGHIKTLCYDNGAAAAAQRGIFPNNWRVLRPYCISFANSLNLDSSKHIEECISSCEQGAGR